LSRFNKTTNQIQVSAAQTSKPSLSISLQSESILPSLSSHTIATASNDALGESVFDSDLKSYSKNANNENLLGVIAGISKLDTSGCENSTTVQF
jgi:hypothetical protein